MAARSSSFKNILTLLKSHKALFGVGCIFLVLGTVANLAIPALLRQLLNDYGVTFIHDHAATVAIGIAALFAFQSICFYGRSYLFGFLGQKVAAELRGSLYQATLKRPIDFFDASRTADLVSRLSADTVSIQDAVAIRLSVLIRYALQVLLGVILMAVISWLLTFIVVAVLLVLIGISIVLGKQLRAVSREQQQALGAASVVAQETFGNARIVKAFDNESREIARYSVHNNDVLRLGLKRTKISSFFQSFVSFLLNTALGLLVLYGVLQVAGGTLRSGDLTAFLAYGVIVAVSFSFIASSYSELVQALGASERVFEVLALTRPLETRGVPVSVKGFRGTDVKFNAVDFTYPSRPDAPVLKNLSFEIPRGQTVALVGPSGAGKSTVVNLLLRFYDPASGSISINGVDLRDVVPSELHKIISFVPQEPELFGVSIAENLRYGKPDATTSELELVCERAGLLDFIRGLPKGFDTVVGDRGTQLSGGQKQRLAIARAMLREPEMLLLDEATSALDSENEALVQKALGELLKGRTALIIAHRLSTIKGADKVIVLDHGKLLQSGSHEALSREPGLYRSLVERQELQGAA